MAELLEKLRDATSRVLGPDLLERVFERMPDPFLVVGPNGEIVLFNGAAELMFGLTKDRVVGQRLEILLPEEARERHVAHRNGFALNPRSRAMGANHLLRGLHSSGRTFDVEVGLTPIQTDEGLYTSALIRGKAS